MRILIVLLLLCGCVAPSQRDPARYGTVRIALGASLDGLYDWRPDQRAQLDPIATELDALGPDFVWVSEGQADVVIRAASLASGACGEYHQGLAYVEVDASCTQGYLAMRRAASHEIVHWYTWNRWRWVGHLCQWPLNSSPPAGCHPTIRCDRCLMAPGLTPPNTTGPGFEEAFVPPVAEPAPDYADLELVRTCQTQSRCTP